VSLSPSTTEAIYAIGAGAMLVGRSRYCDYPPEALRLPQIGGYVDPNLEAILALEPTLVTGARGPSGSGTVDALNARGVATYFPETESIEQIEAMIRGLGARTGRDVEAGALVTKLQARVEAVARAVAGKPRPRVLLVFGIEPIVAAGPRSFADEMLARAGAVNAVTDGHGYPTLGMETVLVLDPDVVLNAAIEESHGKVRISKDTPGWQKLRAVREGRVVPLADEAVLRPGPRVGDGLAQIARAVHPEASVP
jgi:iron complex transport system substrate-binding protein